VQDCLTAGQVKKLHGIGANVTLLNAKPQVAKKREILRD
jgi:hypothetical protein